MFKISKKRIVIGILLVVVAFLAMSTGFLGRSAEDNGITPSSIIAGPIFPFGPIVGAVFLLMDYKMPLSIASLILPLASYTYILEIIPNLIYVYLLSGLISSVFGKPKFPIIVAAFIILLAIVGLISGIYTDKYTSVYWKEEQIKLQSLSKYTDDIQNLNYAEHSIVRRQYITAKLSCDEIRLNTTFNDGKNIKEYCYSELESKKILAKDFLSRM
jgi:hypothetical protein